MKCCRWPIAMLMAVSLFLIFPGCATSGPNAPPQIQDYSRVKDYKFKLGELKAGSFETPPYIPKKIRFELELQLREKHLLASEADTKVLTVNIVSSTYYRFWRGAFARSYSELTSVVEVVDTKLPEIIAKTTIHSYNAWGENTSDFTERDHAKDIAKFLESIVR
jgi:hypothetical protein